MNVEIIRNYCLSKNAVSESFPFDEQTLVFKVGAKIFCLMSLDSIPLLINLKCNPEKALKLREQYETVKPAYHMNKKHWNSIIIDGNLSPKKIYELIDHSYELVIKGMTKKEKEALKL